MVYRFKKLIIENKKILIKIGLGIVCGFVGAIIIASIMIAIIDYNIDGVKVYVCKNCHSMSYNKSEDLCKCEEPKIVRMKYKEYKNILNKGE